jgi:hypothetical protein
MSPPLSHLKRHPLPFTELTTLSRVDRDRLTSEQREPFAKLAMHLAQYLAAGEPAENGGQGGPLKAVDMREFGFRGVPEMMDLVCAVRLPFFRRG